MSWPAKIAQKLADLKTHTGGFSLDQNFCEKSQTDS